MATHTPNPTPNTDLKEAAMPTKPQPNPDPINPANDNHDPPRGAAVPAAPKPAAAGVLASLEALATALGSVDTSSVLGRSGKPMMQFKREGDGNWSFGQKRTIPEPGARWAINPGSFKWGYVAFGENNKPIERLVSISQPKPDLLTLPDVGFTWNEAWSVELKCISGADTGVEVVFKTTTDGGAKAVNSLIEVIRDRITGGEHGGNVVPIATLEKDSYPHQSFGKQWVPVFTIVDWMPLAGPAPAPSSPPPPKMPPGSAAAATEQPRRRRVA
jgi:hypothetical protein